MDQFKVVICGKEHTGKTKFCQRLLFRGDLPQREYTPTVGADVHAVDITDQHGIPQITINIWDLAGNPRFGLLSEGYFIEADHVLIFSEDGNIEQRWKSAIDRVCPNAGVHTVDPENINDLDYQQAHQYLAQLVI